MPDKNNNYVSTLASRFRSAALAFSILTYSSLVQAAEPVDSWTGTDKALHFSISIPFGAVGVVIADKLGASTPFDRIVLGTLIGTIPAIVKEAYDWKTQRGVASGRDLAVSFVGAFVGSMLGEYYIVRPLIQADRVTGVIIERRFEF